MTRLINGEAQGIKMYELIALCSMHLDELSSEDCEKLSQNFGCVFYIGYDKEGKRFVSVNNNGKNKEEAKDYLFNLMSSNNVMFNPNKINIQGN